jgi:hypothetical protein
MITHTIRAVALILALGVGSASAQSASSSLGTVRITKPVLVRGERLTPGAYEVRLTDEFVPPNPGQSADAVRIVEFVKDGNVVARDGAEVMTADAGVGTSGRAPVSSAPRVDLLKGEDFLRISAWRDGKRYLIHLPVAR